MSEYSIQIGATSDFRRIGIQPPLDREQCGQVFDELGDDIRKEAQDRGFPLATFGRDNESAYSELMLNATWMAKEGLTSNTIAERIAGVLSSAGHVIEIEPDIVSVSDIDVDLFQPAAVA